VQILKVHARGKPVAPDLDFDLLARITPGFSGADLANLVNEAALHAARDGRNQITLSDFEQALDKIILGVERPHLTSPEERKVVAYHEGGHALVAVCTEGADPVQKVTIIPRGRALGVTEQVPMDDRLNYPRSYLLGRLAVMMGGRTAEEVVFQEPTTGAENDIDQATKLARRMAAAWGMVDAIGPVHFDGEGSSNVFLGRDIVQSRDFAEQTAARIDQAVTELIGQAHGQARTIIEEHRGELDQIVDQLLEHETISGDEVRRIVGDHAQPARKPLRKASGTTIIAD
jgi:cell division protease FtsH